MDRERRVKEMPARSATMAAMFRSPSRLLLPLLALAPLAAQDVDLRSTAKKGSSVWLLVEQQVSQTFEVMGQEMESAQSTKRVLHVTVDDVDDKGNLTVSVAIARVFGTISNPNMDDMEFDSTKPTEAPEDDPTGGMMVSMLKSLQAGAGKKFTAKASPNGRMLEIVDAKDVLQKGEEAMGLDEPQLKQMVEGAFGRLPEKPTAKGGKWTHEDGGRNGRMPTRTVNELTLSQVDDDTFEIESSGKIEKVEPAAGEDDDNPMAAMLKSMKISNGKATGKQKISRKDGFLIESKHEGSMDAEMTMQGMTVPMKIKHTTTTKRTTEADAKPAAKAAEPKKEAPKAEEPKKAEGHE